MIKKNDMIDSAYKDRRRIWFVVMFMMIIILFNININNCICLFSNKTPIKEASKNSHGQTLDAHKTGCKSH